MITLSISRHRAIMIVAAFVAFAALALASMALTLTRTAQANDNFNDIPTGTFFHDPANFLKNNGIADGFSDGTFRPNNSFTRGQAAFWFSNYNQTIELVKTQINPDPGPTVTHTTPCPAGKRAVAGGGRIGSSIFHMYATAPEPSSGTPTGWKVVWATDNFVSFDTAFSQVWALCVPNNI